MGKEELLEAARSGNITVVGKILEHIRRRSGPLASFRRNPSINGQDVNGYTALHHACLNGHTSIVRLLLNHEYTTPDMPDVRGSTPLYLAAWAGHQEIVKMLLLNPYKPANPNSQTIDNETPLHCAAQHGHNTALAILLAHGADPTIRNNSFQTALDLAAQFGRLQAVQILIRTNRSLVAPFRAQETASDNSSLNGSKPATPVKHIFTHTCLHLASRNGHKKVVETLLNAGVNVNLLTPAGTALHEAALCGKKSVVNVLLQAGVDINATDANGRTALDILKDFPPHVTYEIVSIMKEFSRQKEQQNQFKPISNEPTTDENENYEVYHFKKHIRDKSHSMPKSVLEKRKKHLRLQDTNGEDSDTSVPNLRPKNKSNGLSCSLNSLPTSRDTSESYIKMKPILSKKTTGASLENLLLFKPIQSYASQNSVLNNESLATSNSNNTHPRSTRLAPKSYELMCLASTGGENLPNARPSARYRCVDDYVEMSEPSSARVSVKSAERSPKPPLPSPRNFGNGDYANINTITRHESAPSKDLPTDANNNKHSPTPEFPPPSAHVAEHTIFGFIIPSNEKRRSLKMESNLVQDGGIYSGENTDDPPESLSSDCVEKFVGDVPYAGLFKGSTYNLANIDKNDDCAFVAAPRSLRSPSLVQAIQPIPAKRSVSQQNSPINGAKSEKEIWDEINTILESIGNAMMNDVSDGEQNEIEKLSRSPEESKHLQKNLKIRDPADLVLGISRNTTSTWRHSAYTLMYGQILYNVYYLGSTKIKELHGTASTRKSIQKLKHGEIFQEEQDQLEVDMLRDCNDTTKYLKARTQQSHCKYDISFAISHRGVKFIDPKEKTTICIHNIENINCVCQDAEDLRYFAYITKESNLHYCHVFMVNNLQKYAKIGFSLERLAKLVTIRNLSTVAENFVNVLRILLTPTRIWDLATEIILTLGQAFEVAYQLAVNRASMAEAE